MSVLAEMEKLADSGFSLLAYRKEGDAKETPMGIRLKYYQIDKGTYEYYDFALEHVTNKYHRTYLNREKKSFPTLSLIMHGDVLATQDEIDGDVAVSEITDNSIVENAIATVISIRNEMSLFRREEALNNFNG